MRYFLEVLYRRCPQCRARAARKKLLVDPGVDQPVTTLGVFCAMCARTQLNEYERGRRTFAQTAQKDETTVPVAQTRRIDPSSAPNAKE